MFLCTDMGMGGGAEEQVIRLAYGFRGRGWAPLIVSLLPPSPMPPDFEGRGIPLAHLGMRRGLPDPRGLRRLARIIRDFRPDVVHAHMVHANLLARAVRPFRPFPVLVCTQHNLTMAGIKHDYTRIFEVAHRLTDGLAERTTAISHSAADYYIRRGAVPAAKMMVVPNGIDSGGFERDPAARVRLRRALGIEDRFAWLAVARLEPAKAYPTLLRAFAGLGDGPRTLLICGQGSRRGELEGLAGDLGIGGRVKFLGLRDDIPAVMSAADAFALSSDLEGLPLVLLQASAAGLPIVATDVGGNAEVVEHGVNGEIVPPGNPEAFARGMARIEVLSTSERAAMGDAGLTRVRTRFEAERVIDRWESLYTELLDDAARPKRRRSTASRGDEAPPLVSVSTPSPPQGRDHAT